MSQEKTKTAVMKKRVSLADLLREGKPVWVRNSTQKVSKTGEAGVLSFQIGTGDSRTTIKIPPGNDPVCITDQASPGALATCNDLFNTIRKRGLELLDPEQAEQYYEENEERRDIMEDKIQKLIHESKEEAREPSKVKEDSFQLHNKVQDVVLKAKHDAISERNALEELIERCSAFKAEDYQYLIANGVFASVKKWSKNQYNKLIAGELEE